MSGFNDPGAHLAPEILRKLQATEMRCFKKLLGISYRDHITNNAVRDRIRQAIGPYDDILTTVKKPKLKWFGHVSRSAGLAKTILPLFNLNQKKLQHLYVQNNINTSRERNPPRFERGTSYGLL